MKAFLINVALAITWRAATGADGLAGLVVGFVVGYLLLWWMRPFLGETPYFKKAPQTLAFLGFYVRELILSNLRVARDILLPGYARKPGILAVPLDAKTDMEIALVANLVTFTPGTLSLDVSSDRKTLYIHAMFAADPDAVVREIKDGIERRVLELLR